MSARESRILSEIESDLGIDRRLDRRLSTMRPGGVRAAVSHPSGAFVVAWAVLSVALLVAAWVVPWAVVAYAATMPITCVLVLRWARRKTSDW